MSQSSLLARCMYAALCNVYNTVFSEVTGTELKCTIMFPSEDIDTGSGGNIRM